MMKIRVNRASMEHNASCVASQKLPEYQSKEVTENPGGDTLWGTLQGRSSSQTDPSKLLQLMVVQDCRDSS